METYSNNLSRNPKSHSKATPIMINNSLKLPALPPLYDQPSPSLTKQSTPLHPLMNNIPSIHQIFPQKKNRMMVQVHLLLLSHQSPPPEMKTMIHR
jgi:hypothetical protein